MKISEKDKKYVCKNYLGEKKYVPVIIFKAIENLPKNTFKFEAVASFGQISETYLSFHSGSNNLYGYKKKGIEILLKKNSSFKIPDNSQNIEARLAIPSYPEQGIVNEISSKLHFIYNNYLYVFSNTSKLNIVLADRK